MMEATLERKVIKELLLKYECRLFIENIISDDDSTMRLHCTNITNGVKLQNNVLQPSFSADPNHRRKVTAKPIFVMIYTTKDLNICKKLDALRIKRYTRYYIRQNRTKPLPVFIDNVKAPVEHLFNDHTWCDTSWYWAKDVKD